MSQPNVTADDMIDMIEGNRVYIPCLYVLNKIDSITIQELDLLSQVRAAAARRCGIARAWRCTRLCGGATRVRARRSRITCP